MRIDKENEVLIKEFDEYFKELEIDRCICQEIHKLFGRIIKIRRIYVRRKKDKPGEYYQITYERDERER